MAMYMRMVSDCFGLVDIYDTNVSTVTCIKLTTLNLKFIRGNIKPYLHFSTYLNTEKVQVI